MPDYAANLAIEWINGDPNACKEDVARLGLDGAARYNYELATGEVRNGEEKWDGITLDGLRAALQEHHPAHPRCAGCGTRNHADDAVCPEQPDSPGYMDDSHGDRVHGYDY